MSRFAYFMEYKGPQYVQIYGFKSPLRRSNNAVYLPSSFESQTSKFLFTLDDVNHVLASNTIQEHCTAGIPRNVVESIVTGLFYFVLYLVARGILRHFDYP